MLLPIRSRYSLLFIILAVGSVVKRTYASLADLQEGRYTQLDNPVVTTGQAASQNDRDIWGTGFCDDACTCGVPNRLTRIVGGSPTLPNEYPWVAALRLFRTLLCGGTLITDRHVLTAAHCVFGMTYLLRLAGSVALSRHSAEFFQAGAVTRRIAQITMHPHFLPGAMRLDIDGDIALILLSSPVQFSAKLSPACLPTPGVDYVGVNVTVVGWGLVGETRGTSKELLAVDVPVISQAVCRHALNYPVMFSNPTVKDDMICAGLVDGGVDSCNGDSGGPLMTTDWLNRTVVAGIVSWGEGCARPYRPGVYTRVDHYLSWIQEHTKDACFCA